MPRPMCACLAVPEAAGQEPGRFVMALVFLMRRRVAPWLLFALVCAAPFAGATLETDFVDLPEELGSIVPDRLVASGADLALCLGDSTAKRCLLTSSIALDQQERKQLVHSNGTAVLTQARSLVDITSVDGKRFTLDWGYVVGAIALQPGAKLRLSNLHMTNLAYKTGYTYGAATPFFAVGVGMSIFPTINLAPNTRFVGVNLSADFVNPAMNDTCAMFTEKNLAFLTQTYGQGNVTRLDEVTLMIAGPVVNTIPVRDGLTGAQAGHALSTYKHLTVTCQERSPSGTGQQLQDGGLAAAITVPVVASLLAAALLLLWRRKRHRRASKAGDAGSSKDHSQAVLLTGAEEGHAPRQPPSSSDIFTAWRQGQGRTGQACPPAPPSLRTAPGSTRQKGLARPPYGVALSASRSSTVDSAHRPTPQTSLARSADLPPVAGCAGQGAPGRLPALPVLNVSRPNTEASSTFTASVGTRQHSGSNGVPGTPVATPQFSTGSMRSGLGRARLPGDHEADSTTSLLRARSDAALLKDLKLSSVLGEGSYGRVWRGRWKATPVAVKIIEHSSSREGAGAGLSRGNRISAGREMLFATSISHPNVVDTYHISTLPTSQRSASFSHRTGSSTTTAAAGSLRRASSGSSHSSSSDDGQPEMSTWIVMEFCEKGSLERAMKLGKFKRKTDGQPDMSAIYKALLDTASGLDYLHSIGVVHGDLKTANVLLKGSTRGARGVTCKITDFGVSKVLASDNQTHISTGTYGTIVYMPKELLLSGRMTQATDIYSFGLIMWELYTSKHIMAAEEATCMGQMFYQIAYSSWRPEIPAGCPPGFAELMTACWHEDPEQRPTAQQLLRRLQVLQGQSRQESVSVKKARLAEARATDLGLGYADSAPSGSDTGGQLLLCSCAGAMGATAGSTGSGSVENTGSAGGSSCLAAQPVVPQPAAGCEAGGTGASLNHMLRASQGTGPAVSSSSRSSGHPSHDSGACGRLNQSCAAAAHIERAAEQQGSTQGQQQQQFCDGNPRTDSQLVGSSSIAADAEQYLQGIGWAHECTGTAEAYLRAGLFPLPGVLAATPPFDMSQLQLQWGVLPPVSACPPELGFVSPYGQEFAGCLPDFDAAEDDGSSALMQSYIHALDAAAAARRRAGPGQQQD